MLGKIARTERSEVVRTAGHRHSRRRHLPEDRGERRVRRIAAGGDAHQSIERCLPGGIEDEPTVADAGFETGVEIRRLDVAGITRDIAGRDRQRAAERDPEMREIPAHSSPLGHRVVSGRFLIGGPEEIVDIFKDPVRDGDDLIVEWIRAPKQLHRQPPEPVGLAIATRKQIGNRRAPDLRDGDVLDFPVVPHRDIRLGHRGVGNVEPRGVPSIQADVAVLAGTGSEFFPSDAVRHSEAFARNGLVRAGQRVDAQQHRAAADHIIVELGMDLK